MGSEIAYMLAVVALGFALNFLLRALPFLLFAGRGRALPKWVERFGAYVSPVIIGGLIVYSYATLSPCADGTPSFRTAWPYLAGALTVALQLWKGNSLLSIVAGTVVFMALLSCGCTTSRSEIRTEPADPSFRVRPTGLYLNDELLTAPEIVEAVEDAGIPRKRTIHILIDEDVKDLKPARNLMYFFARRGYSRSLLVTKRHATSEAVDPAKRRAQKIGVAAPAADAKPKVRYKRNR